VSMTVARSSHLPQMGRGWVDIGESKEEEGEKVGPKVVGGGGERGREEVEVVGVGRGEEVRNPTNCRGYQTLESIGVGV
jgi:hypothetical protein